MKTAMTWILLILLAVGGIVGSYALSEKFRTDAMEVWEAKAAQSARWLSGTVLGWLEESYAPLSGLAVLFENSKEVTEVEFLGATDALEARATSFFLDAKAVARPRADGAEWSIEFSNDPIGPLSPDMPLGRHPVILETIKVAVDNADQIMLGSPFSSEEGLRYSPAALAIQDVRGPLVVIGLVNYDAIVKGLFEIHKLDGLQLQIQGRFKEMGGPGPQREVIGKPLPEALHAVTTRTVSAGADLSITWYVNKRFSNGPQEVLAYFTLMGGVGGTLLLVSFFGLLLQRNRTITKKVEEATDELAESRQRLDLALASSGIGTWEWHIDTDTILWDEAEHRIMGTDPAEGVRDLSSLVEIIHPDDAKRVGAEINAALSGDKDYLSDYRFLRPDGEVRTLEARGHVIRNEDGRPLRMIGTNMDITERKQAEAALRQSEERFALTTSGSGDGLWDFDLPGEFFWYSDRFRELLGYANEDDYPNRLESWSDGLHPEDRDATLAAFDAHLAYGKSYDVEYRLITKRGEWRWFRARGKSLRDEKGRAYRAAGSISDITDRKKMEVALRENQERVMQAAEISMFGFWELDLNSQAYVMTDSLWKLFGTSADKEGGYAITDQELMERFIPPEDVPLHETHFQAAITAKDSSPRSMETRFIKANGEIRYGRAQYQIVFDQKGKPIKAFGSFHDFTERKEMDNDLHERIKELDEAQSAMLNMMEDLDEEKQKAEAATQAKGDFLANMSHEIRTPMNAVIGMAHLALKTELTSKQRDYLDKIQSSANSLLGIINDILDFSKIEAGKLDMEAVEFDLLETMDNVANVITVKAQEKENLEVLFYLDSQVPNFLVGDSLRLNQILVNLGNNAVKFTEQGEIVLTTKIMEKLDDKVTLQFSVRDTGIGMTAEQQNKLFQAFSQADTSTTRKYGGTGLGLTISKRLVNMMGGEIWTESEAGQGTTFHFTADFGLGKETVKRRFEPAPDLRGLKVLVVDDNATSREILQDILESFSFEVFLAASGKEALDEIERADKDQPFALVIMDWKMPGMDGLEASRRIKNHPKLRKHPAIVLVTAYGREETMRQADEIGLEGFLLKPVNSSVMFDAIMQALGKEVQDVPRAGRKKEQSAAELHAISGARVLLVEDNEINQQVAQEILQGVGLHVTVVNNGREGVEAAKKNQYDAILMDIQMPVMDGYTATRKIREWERRRKAQGSRLKEEDRGQMTEGGGQRSEDRSQRTDDRRQRSEVGSRNENGKDSDLKSQIPHPKSQIESLPIIAMTAHAMAGDEQKSLEAGMNGHVTKPIDPEQLFAALQKWIKPAAERAAVPKSLPASGGPPILDPPPEPDQAVPDEDELPETLPGFDLAAGLSRLMGNKRLYRKLLLDFGTKYTQTAREIREALDANDFEQAHSLVHNIKGLAGNLEATNLQTSAVNLEKLVKGVEEKTPSAKELRSKFSDLENALKRALASVQTMSSPAAAGAENSQLSPQAIVANTPQISKDDVDRILKAADNGDFEALTAIAEDLKTRSDAYTSFSEKLVELAEDFDFEVIGELVSKLEPSANT